MYILAEIVKKIKIYRLKKTRLLKKKIKQKILIL